MDIDQVTETPHNKCRQSHVYISLWSALNMIDPSGNSGDWHSGHVAPKNLRYAGRGCNVNTLPWLEEKGIITYPDYDSLPHCCPSRNYWTDFPGPYLVANHKRATLDLLYQDFVLKRRTRGLTVDMYAWIDKMEDIQAILDDFQIIVDDLKTTPRAINLNDWYHYQTMIWKQAA